MKLQLRHSVAFAALGLALNFAACAGSEEVESADETGGTGGTAGAGGSDAGADTGSGGATGGAAGSSGTGGTSAGAANGAACAANAECASKWCQDGLCCDGDCSGACRSCKVAGKEGICTLAVAGTDPELECGEASAACSGKCDGVGACAYPGAEKLCGPASCANGKQSAEACDGAGKCSPVENDCGKYQCFGSACLTSCTTLADCTADAWCNAGKCEAKKANGTTCVGDIECTSNTCTLGFCCEGACSPPGSCSTGKCLCDGKACATGKSCVTWYVDLDKDGFGDGSKTKLGCEDTGPNDGGTYAKTGDDCLDTNSNVKPGQTAYFTTHRGDGSYDYNCNNAKELQYSDITGLPCGDCGAKVGQICYSCGGLAGVNTYAFGCTSLNKCTTTGTSKGYDKTVDCGQSDYLYGCGMCSTAKTKDTVPTPQGCR